MNQPDFTEYSPRTIPAMTLRGVVSMLGVLTAGEAQAVDREFQDQEAGRSAAHTYRPPV
ncbi:MAG: hypothetical protein ACLUAR_16545 [Pilosibacter sp.]